MITMLQLSVSIATIYVYCKNERKDCQCYCKIKPSHKIAISETSSFVALISRSLGSYFKTGLSFVGLAWLLTGISEGKILFLPRSMWNM